MLRGFIALVAGLSLFGCDSLSKPKGGNPVFGEVPPRKSMAEQQLASNQSELDEAQFDSEGVFEDDQGWKVRPAGSVLDPESDFSNRPRIGTASDDEVVATVDDQPIFAAEVLERYGVHLVKARQQIPPDQFRILRRSLIKRDLKGHIERTLLVAALRKMLKPEQLEKLDAELSQMFESEIERLKEQLQVNTDQELEAALVKQKTSLASLRDAFAGQNMAREYLTLKTKSRKKIGRHELLDYYRDHLDEYDVPGSVKWQQIVISHAKHGGKTQAVEVLNQLAGELEQGADFGDLARKHSDGPTKANGGHWDWMQAGSLADKNIERALFENPVGEIDHVETDDAFQLVKVTDRKEPSRIPFADVQAEIQQKLQLQQRKDAVTTLFKQLTEQAVVRTIFDNDAEDPPQADAALPFQ